MAEKIKVLELFAGSRSIGKVAEELGYEVFSCDITAFEGINYVGDILEFDYSKIPFIPDIIWASPPCEKWSLACGVEGGNIYWESIKEKGTTVGIKPRENFNVKARYTILKNPDKVKAERDLHISILNKTLEIIDHYKPKAYFIENPFGFMRFYLADKVENINFATYCQYGYPYRKPTNIFSNLKLDLKSCPIGGGCHSNNLYTRGKSNKIREASVVKNYYDRSKIPHDLCMAIMSKAGQAIQWQTKDITPPDKRVEVVDAQGNTAFGYPTYYPFEVVKKEGDERKPWGFRGTPVFFEDGVNKWDGGWMVETGMDVNTFDTVVGWRLID